MSMKMQRTQGLATYHASALAQIAGHGECSDVAGVDRAGQGSAILVGAV